MNESTEYGCCEVENIECDAAVREGDTYSFYQVILDHNGGHWSININKQDEEGSNCPTVEELIYQVSKNDLSNQMLNAIISYTITAMMLMCLCMICRKCMKKEEYEKTDSNDAPDDAADDADDADKDWGISVVPDKKAEKVELVTMKESV